MTWSIVIGADQTQAVFEPAAGGASDVVFVCAHGAGGHMADRSVVAMTSALHQRAISTVRFNFIYKAKRQQRPDPMPRLVECFEAVIERVRSEIHPPRLIVGGRSMGGRVASVLASRGMPCDGLLLLAYPLHPPGQPDKLRVEHLPSIHVPVLCVSGTRDPFCTPELMTRTMAGLGPNWSMQWLDQADHSFHVPKSSGRTDADVIADAASAIERWIHDAVLRPAG